MIGKPIVYSAIVMVLVAIALLVSGYDLSLVMMPLSFASALLALGSYMRIKLIARHRSRYLAWSEKEQEKRDNQGEV